MAVLVCLGCLCKKINGLRNEKDHTALDRRPLTGGGGGRGQQKKQGVGKNPCLHTIEDDTLFYPAVAAFQGSSGPHILPRGAHGTMFWLSPTGR